MNIVDDFKKMPLWAKIGLCVVAGGVVYYIIKSKSGGTYIPAMAPLPNETIAESMPPIFYAEPGSGFNVSSGTGQAPSTVETGQAPSTVKTDQPPSAPPPAQEIVSATGTNQPVLHRIAGHIKWFGGYEPYIAEIRRKIETNTPFTDIAAAQYTLTHPELGRISWTKPVQERVASHIKYFGSPEKYAAAIKAKGWENVQDIEAAKDFKQQHPELFR